MEDEKLPQMWFWVTTLLIAMATFADGVLCPTGCKCENEHLRANCSHGGIEFVPIQLNPELHSMDLSDNKIIHLHYTFSFYEKLVSLDLSRNRIKSLGSGNFRTQRVLKYLNLSHNYIENLTKDSFEGLVACSHLDISDNLLENIAPTAFRDLQSLTVLRLNGNQLDFFENGLFNFTRNLEELFLEDNNFLDIPSALSNLNHLRYLCLSRNLMEVVEDGKVPNLPELKTLVLINNLIIEIQQSAFSTLGKLDHLDLSDNNLTALPTTQLAKLSSLTSLKLNGNSIQILPPVAFRGLFQLKYLSMNRMEHLEQIESRAFVDNINLEKISMDYNVKVKKLPTRLFHGNAKLKYVSVRYNSITAFEASHFPLDQLSELKVGGNPLHCNCSMGWLWQLLQENTNRAKNLTVEIPTNPASVLKRNDLTLDVNEIQCSGPEDLEGKRLAEASKSQMDCSIGWITIVSVVVTFVFIVGIIGGVIVWLPRKKSGEAKTKEIKIRGPTLPNSVPTQRKPPIYELGHHQVDRYIMPTPMILHNNRNMAPLWDPYNQHCNGTMNTYEQLNDHRERPHIVYV